MTRNSAPDDESRAGRRFAAIQLVRLGGVALFLGGIAVLADAVKAPEIVGMGLVALGALGAFLAPQLLAHRWSSNPRR